MNNPIKYPFECVRIFDGDLWQGEIISEDRAWCKQVIREFRGVGLKAKLIELKESAYYPRRFVILLPNNWRYECEKYAEHVADLRIHGD